jgi:hypothetical protein
MLHIESCSLPVDQQPGGILGSDLTALASLKSVETTEE